MTSLRSFDPSRLRGRLRHKLLALWLGSVLVVLLLVGLVMAALMEDFQQREARRDIGGAVAQFRHALVGASAELLRHGDLLAERRQVVA
ncbi:MAG TPA: hypothetical protein VLL76_10800, partial [Candidatus Omnitrophota bacterium]|nr:hypothetical protein [Candidatus Omnitrophota bacterium]